MVRTAERCWQHEPVASDHRPILAVLELLPDNSTAGDEWLAVALRYVFDHWPHHRRRAPSAKHETGGCEIRDLLPQPANRTNNELSTKHASHVAVLQNRTR